MLTFKLSRRGKTKKPFYRLIAVDKKKDPWGTFKEDLGFYNPHTKEAKFKIERIKYWLSHGAQPSATVYNLLIREKIIEGKKVKIKIKKKEEKKTETPKASEEKTDEKIAVKDEKAS